MQFFIPKKKRTSRRCAKSFSGLFVTEPKTLPQEDLHSLRFGKLSANVADACAVHMTYLLMDVEVLQPLFTSDGKPLPSFKL